MKKRLLLCLVAAATASLVIASEQSRAPALLMTDVAAPGQNAAADFPIDPDPEGTKATLQEAAGELINENFHKPASVSAKEAEQKDYKADLLAAQRLRRTKETKGASLALVALLKSDAPDSIKRVALLELAAVACDENELVKAQQIYSQWLDKYPKDPSEPLVLLKQGMLYRKMGADNQARNKFYAVMRTALNLPPDHLKEYQRMVLLAQTEIADTYQSEGNFSEAIVFYKKLLKLDAVELNKAEIQYKLVHAYSQLGMHAELVALAKDFTQRYPENGRLAETRFLLSKSLKAIGRNSDSLQQVMILLESKSRSAAQSPADWAYWQQRTGNEIANQLYQEGDYLKALTIYENLAALDKTVQWQLPVWYQIGLVYEKLSQPQKAKDQYQQIIDREPELAANSSPGLRTVVDMSKWRLNFLGWEMDAEKKANDLKNPATEPSQTASVSTPPSQP